MSLTNKTDKLDARGLSILLRKGTLAAVRMLNRGCLKEYIRETKDIIINTKRPPEPGDTDNGVVFAAANLAPD